MLNLSNSKHYLTFNIKPKIIILHNLLLLNMIIHSNNIDLLLLMLKFILINIILSLMYCKKILLIYIMILLNLITHNLHQLVSMFDQQIAEYHYSCSFRSRIIILIILVSSNSFHFFGMLANSRMSMVLANNIHSLRLLDSIRNQAYYCNHSHLSFISMNIKREEQVVHTLIH